MTNTSMTKTDELRASFDEEFDIFMRPSLAGEERQTTYKVTFLSARDEDLAYYVDGDDSPWSLNELMVEAEDMKHAIDKIEFFADKADSTVSIYSIKRLTPPQLYPPEDLN